MPEEGIQLRTLDYKCQGRKLFGTTSEEVNISVYIKVDPGHEDDDNEHQST